MSTVPLTSHTPHITENPGLILPHPNKITQWLRVLEDNLLDERDCTVLCRAHAR